MEEGRVSYTAKDIMVDLLATVQGDATLDQAAAVMLQMDIGSLLVVDGRGHLAGILTDTDFGVTPAPTRAGKQPEPQVLGHRLGGRASVAEIYRAASSRRVRDVMSAPVITVEEGDPVETVLARMFENRIRHLPVVRGQIPVGIISSRDLLHLVFDQQGENPKRS